MREQRSNSLRDRLTKGRWEVNFESAIVESWEVPFQVPSIALRALLDLFSRSSCAPVQLPLLPPLYMPATQAKSLRVSIFISISMKHSLQPDSNQRPDDYSNFLYNVSLQRSYRKMRDSNTLIWCTSDVYHFTARPCGEVVITP